MEIGDYLVPTNLPAECVVYLMALLFVIWLALLAEICIRHWGARSTIRKFSDAGTLLRPTTMAYGQLAVGGVREPNNPTDRERERTFRQYLDRKQLSPTDEIALHVCAIFEAGWNRSRLDERSLVRNTTDHLFRWNSLLRSILSVFIILGILGTLFGLADTIGDLGGSVQKAKTVEDMLRNVTDVFGELKSAFAPSIIGVLITAFGLLLMAVYVRVIAVPLTVLLERTTITVWMPQLMPTPAQARETLLHLEEEQTHRNAAAVRDAVTSMEGFHEKAEELGASMKQADDQLKQMAKSSAALNDFSERFTKGASALVSFQQEIKELYQQMALESKAFQDSVRKNVEGSQEFQTRVQQQLGAQHDHLSTLLTALQSYESAYIRKREDIDLKLGVLLDQAKETFGQLSLRNDELAQAMDAGVGKPLRENLDRSLNAVQQELQKQLGDINGALLAQLKDLVQQLSALDGPIKGAAREFSDTFANFSSSSRLWFEKIHREFAGQNETSQKQLQSVETLATQLPELVQGLTVSRSEFAALSRDMGALRESIVLLTQNLSSLPTMPPTSRPPRRPKKENGGFMNRFMKSLRGQADDA